MPAGSGQPGARGGMGRKSKVTGAGGGGGGVGSDAGAGTAQAAAGGDAAAAAGGQQQDGAPAAPAAPVAPKAPSPSAAAAALLAANPALMMQNPLLAMQVLNSGLLNQQAAAKAPAPVVPPPKVSEPGTHLRIDPDVQELCDHFEIEDRHLQRLNEIMKGRQDSFEGDMLKLWEKLEDAREPAGLLVVKMREMEEGTFVGKQKADKQLADMVKKFGLDNMAEARLADILSRFDDDKRKGMYEELERHLEVSNRPSAMVMMLLKKLSAGEGLGRPGPPAPGSYVDKKNRERGESKSDRRGDRDRDRRDRSRDRGRGGRSRSRRR